MSDSDDLFSLYLEYSAGTECPTFFHRWAITVCLGAYLGRNIYFRQGHFKVHPNLYVMLVGNAGTKKSTSIKMATRLMQIVGYQKFAAKKTRQEKFLLDMAEEAMGDLAEHSLEANLFGEDDMSTNIAESLVAADEFNNFIGLGNLDFMSILGELWDYEGVYDYKLKNSKSVYLNNPTVSILGGNTPTGMNACFPPDSIGQGFFSRLILVYAEPTGIRHTWMPKPDPKLEEELVKRIRYMQDCVMGEITLTPIADKLLDKIYKTWKPIGDVRFESYANRRFPQLLKLVLTICAAYGSTKITEEAVVYANTLLTFTEKTMGKALGEFGKGRHSDITHKVLELINGANKPLVLKDVWKHVYSDLERKEQIVDILNNLIMAEKIQMAEGGYLPLKPVSYAIDNDTIDWSLLTTTEKKGIVS